MIPLHFEGHVVMVLSIIKAGNAGGVCPRRHSTEALLYPYFISGPPHYLLPTVPQVGNDLYFCFAVISISQYIRRRRLSFPWTSAGVATGYALMWKSVGFHKKCHGSWHFRGKSRGWGNGAYRGCVRGKVRRTNHGKQRTSAGFAVGTCTAVAISTHIRCHCHGNAAISTEVRGNYLGNFRGRPTAAICPAIHGRPQLLPRQSFDSDTHCLTFPAFLP